ncbi:uncharacterized protein LODBEIA_P15590 [Lodderomyces beijingensis]|uniref:N-acetyltransferase domain-containing protein n=1 Tax=Lodderomyces beijingensis TaxID=1775926 RepID=A0ABP0ZM26_9ASCO
MGRNVIALDDLTVNNVGVFKKINNVVLACKYPEEWYQQSLDSPDSLVQLAFYAELPVGAIKAKSFNNNMSHPTFNESANSSKILQKAPNCVYIESLAVLDKYRDLGIGSQLVEWLVEQTRNRFIHEIMIHVEARNSKIVEWYAKRGFVKGEIVVDYYKDQGLQDPDALIMKRTI